MINPEKILKKITLGLLGPLIKKKTNTPDLKDWTRFKRVLVFRLDNKLGNAILLLPLIQSIKKSLPAVKIDVIYSKNYSEIFDHHPDISSVIEYDQQYLLRFPVRFFSFIQKMRRSRYDVVISSTNPNSFSVSQALFAGMLKTNLTIGFDWKNSSQLYSIVIKGNTNIHYSHAQVDLWRYFDGNAKSENPKVYFQKDKLNKKDSPQILFWFGATGNKILSSKLFDAISLYLEKEPLDFQLAAGPHDEHLLKQYPSVQKDKVVFLKGNLKETAAFFKQYKLIIIPDTGPLHLTVALGIPTVQVFVNSDPVWYAYSGEKIFLINKKLESARLSEFIKKYL